ncbi:MAG: tetraacyldisaccharide 4'-kinase, partial [Rubrivivax sp.]|nr:tetraacyldisaccharide 4'-kinase [Rubrivivax sp.]
ALADWWAGRSDAAQPLAALRGRRLLAMAGIAAPERFFAMLEAAGLNIERLPLADHHDHAKAAWPAGTTELVTTEKDAVKLGPQQVGGARVWVVGLDFELPPDFVGALLHRLGPAPATRPPP